MSADGAGIDPNTYYSGLAVVFRVLIVHDKILEAKADLAKYPAGIIKRNQNNIGDAT